MEYVTFLLNLQVDGAVCSLKEDKEDRFNLMNRWRLALLLAQT